MHYLFWYEKLLHIVIPTISFANVYDKYPTVSRKVQK